MLRTALMIFIITILVVFIRFIIDDVVLADNCKFDDFPSGYGLVHHDDQWVVGNLSVSWVDAHDTCEGAMKLIREHNEKD